MNVRGKVTSKNTFIFKISGKEFLGDFITLKCTPKIVKKYFP